ncbi:MAG: hypothetical protein JF601_12070, partial [Acidobacteria bacterium]|nr:hypothetical protein [Acidobacteriota bacterium]
DRLQGLRGAYGIKSPAPICADPSEALAVLDSGNPAMCQVVQAPAGDGQRLVPAVIGSTPSLATTSRASYGARPPEGAQATDEIRLTYRELSALIEDAIRQLR